MRRLIRVYAVCLVMVDYKNCKDQALTDLALIGDKSSKGAYSDVIPT